MADGMVDLKNIQEEDKYPEIANKMERDFPYGLQLYLCDDVVVALKAGNLKPGDAVSVKGVAVVTTKNEHSDIEDTDTSITLQMTKLMVNKTGTDRADAMYSSNNGGEGNGESD